MTPKTLEKANQISKDIDRLEDQLNDWERAEKPEAMLTTYIAGEVPEAAWITFRNACKEDLQRKIDAKRIELADL